MRKVLAEEIDDSDSSKTNSVADRKANRLRRISWFIRVCGVLALFAAMPRIIHEGWPHSVRTCGSLSGIFNASLMLVLSFLFVTTGKTKLVIAGATIILATWLVVFSAAMLVLPHL